jgi:hypothetical protein
MNAAINKIDAVENLSDMATLECCFELEAQGLKNFSM